MRSWESSTGCSRRGKMNRRSRTSRDSNLSMHSHSFPELARVQRPREVQESCGKERRGSMELPARSSQIQGSCEPKDDEEERGKRKEEEEEEEREDEIACGMQKAWRGEDGENRKSFIVVSERSRSGTNLLR
ncbi:hypothetical protein BHE74_00023137 [Ensete ventricosum]|nr:hypothetical protein BHE74_00023137 [Ensete ventricosum]RZS02240.1 hypothetical protein BHM03_00032245 [Ensete ventricosum]